MLLRYPYCKILFTVHTDASYKQSGAIISHNNKPISFFSRILSKPQLNYTTTDNELLEMVECPKLFRGILFGYEINLFPDHNNLVYNGTLSESQREIRWRLILEEFGPNIKHISGVENISADTLSIFLSTPSNRYECCTKKAKCRAYE